jgi:hypothetical protein
MDGGREVGRSVRADDEHLAASPAAFSSSATIHRITSPMKTIQSVPRPLGRSATGMPSRTALSKSDDVQPRMSQHCFLLTERPREAMGLGAAHVRKRVALGEAVPTHPPGTPRPPYSMWQEGPVVQTRHSMAVGSFPARIETRAAGARGVARHRLFQA